MIISTGESKSIRREPFARGDVVRRTVEVKGTTCAFCGSEGKPLKNGNHRLFQYGFEHDSVSGNKNPYAVNSFGIGAEVAPTCSKSCHDAIIGD